MRTTTLTGFVLLLTAGIASAQTGGFKTFGKGCPGTNSAPAISSSGVPLLGQKFAFYVKTGMKSGKAVLIIGATNTDYKGLKLPFPLDTIGAPGCQLYVGLSVMIPTALDSNGIGTNAYVIPKDVSIIGAQLYCQYYVSDPKANPLGLVTSDAALAVVGS
jgi:hypothetical protein